jgi:hypothetical protein
MSWNAVYISGKIGFKEVLLDKLKASWLSGTAEPQHDLIMFWMRENIQLRDLKLAIGAKLIFKYRLHFITNLAKYIKSESDGKYKGFSLKEKQMVLKMVTWERAHANVLRNELMIGAQN